MTYNQTLICFFPFIELKKTDIPLYIRGMLLFPLSLIDKIDFSEEDRDHARKLSKLFYWYNNKHVSDPVLTILPATENSRTQHDFIRTIEDIHKLLGYLCCLPDTRPEYFNLLFDYEQVDYYLFEALPYSVWQGFINCIQLEQVDKNSEKYYEGAYEYSINQGEKWSIIETCRLYPAYRSISRSLILDEHLEQNINVLKLFKKGSIELAIEQRVLSSLEWYNRSCSKKLTADITLLSLAIAFETLFGIRRDNGDKENLSRFKIQERLLFALELFLGDVPRLSDWLEQFYNARSRIVHEGEWSQMRFSVGEKNKQSYEYGYLIHYGLLIFRICVNSFLSGRLAANKINLSSKFIHNQERLESIAKTLAEKNTEAFTVLHEIVNDIRYLYDNPLTSFRPTLPETIYNVGIQLVTKLLEVKKEITNDQHLLLEQIIVDSKKQVSYPADEFSDMVQHISIVIENTTELPDKVRQEVLKDLKKAPPIEEIKGHIQQLIADKRNMTMSKHARSKIESISVLIDYFTYRSKLTVFISLAKGGNFINERDLFSLIEGYASFVKDFIEENRSNANLYIAGTNLFFSEHNAD